MASWLIRVAIVIHALALFIIVFDNRQTHFGNVLFMTVFIDTADPYDWAVWTEKITVSLFLLTALVVLFKPWWPLLLLLALYAFAEAASGVFQGGYRYSEWTLAAQALRFTMPLVLLVMVGAPRLAWLRPWTLAMASSLLRVAVASVFFAHGYLALLGNPGFIDLIIGSFGQMLDVRVREAQAVTMLHVIAIVDFCVALAVLIYPRPLLMPRAWWASPCPVCPIRRVIVPSLMIWLSFWGLLTALSRIFALGLPTGLGQYPELLIRASHVLGPLALWCLFACTYRSVPCEPAACPRESTVQRPASPLDNTPAQASSDP